MSRLGPWIPCGGHDCELVHALHSARQAIGLAMKQLDTQPWNLGAAALLAVASLSSAIGCGPAVELDEDTDGGSAEGTDTIIDPSSPTDPTDPTDPTSGDCEVEGCPEGFYCDSAGRCIEEYGCYDYDYGCYCIYGHCSPGYDCYDDEDCGAGELCEGYNGCDVLQSLSDCGGPATLEGTPLAIPTGNPIGVLAFVDLDPQTPGEDLVVGTDIDGWLLPSGGEAVALPSEGGVRAAAAADLDGDALIDLVLLDAGGLSVLYGFGSETLETVRLPSDTPFVDVHVLRSPEGPSLLVQAASGAISTLPGASERVLEVAPTPLPEDPDVTIDAFAVGDGSDELLRDSASEASLYDLAEASLMTIAQPRRSERTMVVGSLTGAARSDIVWASSYPDWTLLELSIGGAPQLESRAIYFDYPTYATGDLDGDGNDDVLAVGLGGLAVMPGDSQWGLTCFSQAPFDGGASRILAVGDLDGDGIDEAVVITDAGGAPAQYDITWGP